MFAIIAQPKSDFNLIFFPKTPLNAMVFCAFCTRFHENFGIIFSFWVLISFFI